MADRTPLDAERSRALGYQNGHTAATARHVPNAASHGWCPQPWEADMDAFWEGYTAALADAGVVGSATMAS